MVYMSHQGNHGGSGFEIHLIFEIMHRLNLLFHRRHPLVLVAIEFQKFFDRLFRQELIDGHQDLHAE